MAIQNYTVSLAIDGRIDIDVRASSPEEARRLATNKFCTLPNEELSNIEIVGTSAVNATDESGNLIDF